MKPFIENKKIPFLKIFFTIILLFFTIAIAVNPKQCLNSCYNGVCLWATSVMPSLLPFFFITTLLTKMEVVSPIFNKTDKISKFVFRTNGITLYAFFMSVLSGYPVGSKTISDLYLNGLIDEDEAKRASVFCSTSGPLFIVGAVGVAMFNSAKIGYILLLSHILSAVLTGITFRFKGKYKEQKSKLLPNKNADNILYDAVYSAVISVLIVGGFISVFFVLGDILFTYKILNIPSKILSYPLNLLGAKEGSAEGLLYGILECTRGCSILSKINTKPITIALCSFLISFGGFSILMQSLVYLTKAKIKPLFFIGAKFLQAIYSAVLSFLLCFIF